MLNSKYNAMEYSYKVQMNIKLITMDLHWNYELEFVNFNQYSTIMRTIFASTEYLKLLI